MKKYLKPLIPSMILVAIAAFIFGNVNYLEAYWVKWIYGQYAFAPNVNDGFTFSNLFVPQRKISADLPGWEFIRSWSWIILLVVAAKFLPKRDRVESYILDFGLLLGVWCFVVSVIIVIAGLVKRRKAKMASASAIVLMLFGSCSNSKMSCDHKPVYYDIPDEVMDSIKFGLGRDTLWMIKPGATETSIPVIKDIIDHRDQINVKVIVSNCLDTAELLPNIDSSFKILNAASPVRLAYDLEFVTGCHDINDSYANFSSGPSFDAWRNNYLRPGFLSVYTGKTKTENGQQLLGYTPVIQNSQEVYAYETPVYDFIVMSDAGYFKKGTFAHEFGHWLGQGHTFEMTPEEKELFGITPETVCGNFQTYNQCYIWRWTSQQNDHMLYNYITFRKPYMP